MATNFDISLPEIIPDGDIRVTAEEHLYKTFVGDNDTILEEREYTLDKAPVKHIKAVTGIADGDQTEFTEGVDYELSDDGERIVWLDDPATRPDAGTTFAVTYRCTSIISRYTGSMEAEFETTDEHIDDVISGKFVDSASGDELDQIGSLFGVIGERAGRDDRKYRNYLRAVVQAFSSRGKQSDIREAIAASLSGVTEETRITTDDVEIVEDFENTEYDIVLYDWTSHSISTLYEIAQIVDPSGVHQNDLQYVLPQQESQAADEVVTTDGLQVVDEAEATIVDVILNIGIDETTDTSLSSDEITEEIHIRAATPKSWDTSSWDSFDWDGKSTSELIDAADTIGSAVKLDAGTDSATVGETVSQSIGEESIEPATSFDTISEKSATVVPESPTITEIVSDEITTDTADTSGSADAATATATTVIWDGGTYDQMNWN